MKTIATPEQVQRHNDITRICIMGLMVSLPDGVSFNEVADNIMELLERRGYIPNISACNRLADGTHC